MPSREAAGAYIRALLDGGTPNGAPPEAFGEYRDVVELLVQAHAHGGTAAVRDVGVEIVRRHPELAEIIAGDQPTSDEAARDPWPIYTLADAYQARPPLIYVVQGLFPLPSLSIVYGAPGTIKSLLLADLQ